MKNKVTILNNLSAEITPISISDLNITPELPSGITVPNDSYGGFIPIHYNIDYDINFSAVKFYLNDELVHTSNKPTDTFNINVTTEFNKLSGYSVNRFDLKLPQTEFEVIFKSTLDQTKSQLEISKILKYNLPNFILDEYPVFVDFIEAYYQFLEKSNNPNLIHYNLENYKDIDNVPEYIVDYFRKELIPNFDLNLAKDRQTGESLNERVLIKHIKEFYDSKGTENSIKFLFRILFDKEATIFYPKVNLLKPSDGLWTIDKTIDVYGTDIVRLYGLAGSRIYQRKTTGEIESHAIIKNVNVKKIPGGFQGSLFLYELSGTFSNTTPILLKEVLDGVSVETPLTVIKISNKNLTISSGRRDSLGGNLSETKRLIPDNDYWQNASYDVQGDADPKSFISIIKKLAHPAGFKIFASYSPTLKLSKTINIKNEVLSSNLTFGSPKTFLNDLIAKTDSLDILLVGDSNIHFGSQDGGYMYGWSYTLDELGVPCYSTPLFPSLTRSLAGFGGASGIFKYFPGAEHTRVYSAGAGTTIPAEATGGAHVEAEYGQSIIPPSIANSWNSDIVAISGGWGWSMALTKEGKVYAWGNNDQGQCRGTNSSGVILKPNPYEDGTNAITINGVVLEGVTTISAGGHQGAALKNGGVIMWGNNSNYTTPSYLVSVPSNALSNVDQMSGGDTHTMIIKAGKVYCWGRNNAGECLGTTSTGLKMNLANGYTNTVSNANTPVQIMGVELTNIVKIFGSRFFSVALDINGKVWSWGDYGQDLVPSILSSGASDINASTFNGYAIKDGKVVGWGNNLQGQCLGSDSSGNLLTSTPNGDYVKIRGNILTDVIAITGGGVGNGTVQLPLLSFSVALKKDGSIVTWGSNYYGQCLGTNSSGNPITSPALADGSTAFKINGSSLSNISSISCGGAHLMALYSGNATYDSATGGYWWKSNSSFNNVTGTLVKNDTWVGSTVTDTYATWINNIWKCGAPSGTKTTSGWHTFNSLVDWAYIKPGVTTSYDSTRNINIAKTGFIDADQTLGANKIYGLNPAWYGNFPVEKELNYRNVNVKFPGTNGGSIYLTSRNATNVSGSATPSYYGRYSTDSGSTTEYKIQADVLPIAADSSRKYVDAAWQGAHSGNFGKGPIATLLESVSVKNQKGYAVNSFHARSGHSAQDIASGLEAAGTESIKIYLKEIRDRQISSGGSGRVLIFVNMGINSNGGLENTLFGNRAERIIVSISTAWSALGYPKSDLGFLISNSHNGGISTYSNPTAVIATAEYLKNKYSNVMLVNFDNDSLGSITRLTNISGYINANSSVDAKSTGTTNPQVHLSQGRNVLTGTTTKTLNGEGGYAAVISGLINTVKTLNFTSPITSIITNNSTVNNTQENTVLTIGNYLAYSSDIVQDLNFLKTDNTDDSTDITSTYRAFPEGLPFGEDGKNPTVAAKSYISLISSIAAINISQFKPELIEEQVYYRPNFIGGNTFTGTVDNKLTSAITNIGQLIGQEEISERWECGNHPRTVLNPSEQIFAPDAAFGDLKISDFVGEEDPRSDREKLLLDKESVDCSKIKNKECREACEAHQRFVDTITRNDAKSKKELDDMEYANKSEIAWAHLAAAGTLLVNICGGAIVKRGVWTYYGIKGLVVGKTLRLAEELEICLNGFKSGMGPLTEAEIKAIAGGVDFKNSYNAAGIKIVEYGEGWSRTFGNMVKEGDAIAVRCAEQDSLGAPIIITKMQQQANTLIPELTTAITKLYGGRSTKQAILAFPTQIEQELTAKLPVLIDRAVTSSEAARGIFWKLFSSEPQYWDYSYTLEIWERMGVTKKTVWDCMANRYTPRGMPINPVFLKQAEESRRVVVKANIGVHINTPRIIAQAGQNITQATLLSNGLASRFTDYSWGIFTGETAVRRAELSEKNCMDNFEVWNKATTQRIIENKTAWNEYVEAEKKCRPCSDGSSGSGSGASGGGSIGSSGYGTSGVNGGPNSPGLNLLDEPLDPLDPKIIDEINNTLDGFYKSFTVKNKIEESSQDVINRL